MLVEQVVERWLNGFPMAFYCRFIGFSLPIQWHFIGRLRIA
jgi:hypothetical protein